MEIRCHKKSDRQIQREDEITLFTRLAIGAGGAAMIATTAVAQDVRLRIAGTVPAEHFGNAVLEQMAKDIEESTSEAHASDFYMKSMKWENEPALEAGQYVVHETGSIEKSGN